MSSTSKKHRNFVSEPIGNKPVTDLAGVGPVLGQRLEAAGYEKANSVLGQYLVLNGNQPAFQAWMKETCQANSTQSANCYNCLKEWSDQNM